MQRDFEKDYSWVRAFSADPREELQPLIPSS